MSRKIVRLTLDHLEELAGAVPLLPVLGARPGTPRPARRTPAPRRTPGSRRCCATGARAAGSSLVDDVPVGYVVYAPDGVRARGGGLPDRAGLARRGPADHGVRRAGAPRRRAGPDAGAGDGPRPDRARRHRAPSRRSATPAGRRRRAACCRSSSSAAWASRPSAPHATTPRMRMDLRTARHLAGRGRGRARAAGRRDAPARRSARAPGAEGRRGPIARAPLAGRSVLSASRSGDVLGELVEQRRPSGGRRRWTSRPRRPGRR